MKTARRKPTPGPWTVHDPNTARPSAKGNIDKRIMVLHPDCERLICDLSQGFHGSRGILGEIERIANAELIAEAGTVYHETGLTPREILDQRNALWDALENIAHYQVACGPMYEGPCIKDGHMEEIKAAIAKVMNEGRNAEEKGDATA